MRHLSDGLQTRAPCRGNHDQNTEKAVDVVHGAPPTRAAPGPVAVAVTVIRDERLITRKRSPLGGAVERAPVGDDHQPVGGEAQRHDVVAVDHGPASADRPRGSGALDKG